MNCEQVREQIPLYLYDELTADTRAALDDHVRACSACAAELAAQQRLHERLNERPLRLPSPELVVECRSLLEERLAEEAMGWRALGRAWLAGTPVPAASRALAVLGILILGFGAGWTMRPQVGTVPAATVPGPVAAGMTDLSNLRIAGIRQVAADPQTGAVQLTVDAEQRMDLRGTVDDPGIQRLLIYTVKNYENPGIRRESLELLGRRPNDPEVRDVFIYAVLNDRNDGVRRAALSALSEMQWDEPIRQTLIQVLAQDANPGMRVAAVNLLAEHADDSVVPVFRQLSETDKNPYVRLKCASTLRAVSGEN
jgi:hypothetical protein